ncbi:MAG TPA: His/Gly/Thr/Pro-type tRNA ligase C-terminal domain-containing protein [Pyrinomonadaceae bacterium]
MTLQAIATTEQAIAAPSYYVVTPDDVVPIEAYPRGDLGAGMACLFQQEILEQREERVSRQLAELFRNFGFEWEPLSEPGHMRFVGHAAFMLDQAKSNAEKVAISTFQSLDIPVLRMDGVSIVDPSSTVMSEYLRLTSLNAGLYGDSPYDVTGAGSNYNLRQTGCFQKYSACLQRSIVAASLPIALFEISDSFRREPADRLQLGFRLRRFHLPEAHVHGKTISDVVEISLQLHRRILEAISELEPELVLLINATHEFATANHGYFKQLASQAKSLALLKVAGPGEMCEDGVEVDVEYKLVDADGCCRELSTFQFDETITRNFGVRCDDGTTPSTIHAVLTGGIERYLYFLLDRIVRTKRAGLRRHLPLWISPVVARVVPSTDAVTDSAVTLARQLSAAGIRVQLDDRGLDQDSAIHDADEILTPYFVVVDESNSHLKVRGFESGQFKEMNAGELIDEIQNGSARSHVEYFQRLSRQPLNMECL